MAAGRPKLDPLTKQQRLIKRLLSQKKEIEEYIKIDPDGPEHFGGSGRPPVKYKVKKERIELKLNEAIDNYEKMAKELGIDKKPNIKKISKVYDPSENSGVGRPSKMEIQDIEYKIRQKESRIKRIESGEEASKRANLKTKAGKHLGRLPKSDEQKIERLKAQIAGMKAMVTALERKLSEKELEELKIRRMRRMAADMRAKLREEDIDHLRLEAHENWEVAKESFPPLVIECVAVERAIDEKTQKLKYWQ